MASRAVGGEDQIAAVGRDERVLFGGLGADPAFDPFRGTESGVLFVGAVDVAGIA